ncbi:MAG: hypothetical protein DRH57_01250 [Candidatus Cloacimonadota bacterium]|nr:MAG: hypothetical protein DRH57_01250 [Candidatus Cloacimonadota bacterium]
MKFLSIKKPIEQEDKEMIKFLSKFELFTNLSSTELHHLAKCIHKREFSQGEIIFKNGYPNIVFYIIKSGEVKIYIEKENGEEIELNILGEYDFFGEFGLFLDTSRTASCMAVKETAMYAISKTEFKSFINKFPRGGNKILFSLGKILSQHIIHLNEKLKHSRLTNEYKEH